MTRYDLISQMMRETPTGGYVKHADVVELLEKRYQEVKQSEPDITCPDLNEITEQLEQYKAECKHAIELLAPALEAVKYHMYTLDNMHSLLEKIRSQNSGVIHWATTANRQTRKLLEIAEPCDGCDSSPVDCVGAADCERLKA